VLIHQMLLRILLMDKWANRGNKVIPVLIHQMLLRILLMDKWANRGNPSAYPSNTAGNKQGKDDTKP